MPNGSAAADEIWELIKETRADIKESRKEMKESRKESRKEMKESRKEMKEFRKRMDELRASQRETDRQLKETDRQLKETDRQLKETDRQQKETGLQLKQTDRQLKQTDRRFNSQWGRLVESLVEGNLAALLQARGIEVQATMNNVKTHFARDDGVRQNKEFDILMVNGTDVVVVEVKTTLTPEKVRHFLTSMEDVVRYFPDYRSKRVYGAVAYVRNESQAALHAERHGLFVIRATGDSASIVNGDGFRPVSFSTGQTDG